MDRCSPAEMRKNLYVIELLKNAGIDFVPIPVRNPEHKKELIKTMEDAFNEIIAESENT